MARPVPKITYVDLRSDTVTRPSKDMLAFMSEAPVGDDVLGDDPSVQRLEEMMAEMFGMEAGLFCPSGTMTNQIGIKLHTQPGDELICCDSSHVYVYESGGVAANSGVQVRALVGDRGRLNAAQIASAINRDDVHLPHTSLVCLENSTNKGGGACYDLQVMMDISALCKARGLKLHLDGARIFNAIIANHYTAKHMGPIFDSISVCLSKGMGCPVGSVLLGSKEFIKRGRRVRKMMGGGMRQAGYLAAAGIYALENGYIESLAEDHANAKQLETTLFSLKWVASVLSVETNIVIFDVAPAYEPADIVKLLLAEGVMANQVGERGIRFVAHRDVRAVDPMVHARGVLRGLKP